MQTDILNNDLIDNQSHNITITNELVEKYSLDKWSEEFSLMTAGYRDRLDPNDVNNPEAPFNSMTVAICIEAKARVFEKKLAEGELGSVHIGGEVRPHTQDFIILAARIYAAHGFQVHLRCNTKTTPIWYSSFGIFFEEIHSGDNFTASHSQFFKGGWKPLDREGKQLLAEEKEIVTEVKDIVTNRDVIKLSPWQSNQLISYDFDVDDAYTSYLRSSLGADLIGSIMEAGNRGFVCSVSPLGGSMKSTTERIFSSLGISTGDRGIVRYFLEEEDSQFHQIGHLDDNDIIGPDPGNPKIYHRIIQHENLLDWKSDLILIWDPDGDRLKIAAPAPLEIMSQARDIGLEVEEERTKGRCIVYFTSNQLYLMLTAFRIEHLRITNKLESYDWFVGLSYPTTKSIEELATSEGIPCVHVPVGFKHIGDLCKRVEEQLGGPVEYITTAGKKLSLGKNTRALILCEESGGATLGSHELLESKSGKNKMLALREKDGFQIGLLTIALGACLNKTRTSFAKFYCGIVSKHKIEFLYYRRRDIKLYDEGLIGKALDTAKEEGLKHRDQIVSFFKDLIYNHTVGRLSIQDVQQEINSRRKNKVAEIKRLKYGYSIDDGILLESEDLRFILRASGTDAVLRYYVEGRDKNTVEAIQQMLIDLNVS